MAMASPPDVVPEVSMGVLQLYTLRHINSNRTRMILIERILTDKKYFKSGLIRLISVIRVLFFCRSPRLTSAPW
jgi:hypothetical protein